MSKGGSQTVTTRPDRDTRDYLSVVRNHARDAANNILTGPGGYFVGPYSGSIGDIAEPFMSPYTQNVIDPLRAEFDLMRGNAVSDVNAAATQAGAFGGSRHGLLAGERLAGIDRAQAGTVGNLLNQGYQQALGQGVGFMQYNNALRQQQLQEPLFRYNQALNFLNMGLGPTGQTTTQPMNSNPLGGAFGGAVAGMGAFGPIGAGVGGLIGLLG